MSTEPPGRDEDGVSPSGAGRRPAGVSHLDVVDVTGEGRSAGATYGEACRPLIQQHLEMVYGGAEADDRPRDSLRSLAESFRSAVRRDLPSLADEIDGIAEGAHIEPSEAWLLQLRAEAVRMLDSPVAEAECTSFGVTGPATATGTTIAGQNGDLPGRYQDLLVLIRRADPRHPRYLTLTPAGQLAWHGMNEDGLAVFANFLLSGGWRIGIPRYLFTRVALVQRSVSEAATELRALRRASSRNLLLADEHQVVDVELTVDDSRLIEARDGRLAHTNHFLASPGWEKSTGDYLEDSRVRLQRIETLLAGVESIDVTVAQEILRDRASYPYTISRIEEDLPNRTDFVTVASTIAEVHERRLWVALGPAHAGTYRVYDV